LLCLYGLGTNTGLKRMAVGEHGATYKDLLYARRRFIIKDQLRHAITFALVAPAETNGENGSLQFD
jgi:hypothetical protein